MVGSFGTRKISLYFSFDVVRSWPEQASQARRFTGRSDPAIKREFYQTDRFASEAIPAIGKFPDTVNSK